MLGRTVQILWIEVHFSVVGRKIEARDESLTREAIFRSRSCCLEGCESGPQQNNSTYLDSTCESFNRSCCGTPLRD